MKSVSRMSTVSGFSLVELMVVVGIIGVLATIAIPQYSKFTARAKQSEAKVQLGAIYTVEKAFFVEGGEYSSCLSGIGYGVEGNKRRYKVGFSSNENDSVSGLTCGNPATSGAAVNALTPGVHYFPAAIGRGDVTSLNAFDDPAPASAAELDEYKVVPATAGTGGTGGTAPQVARFRAGAHGDLGALSLDKWTIDENQDLKNPVSGI